VTRVQNGLDPFDCGYLGCSNFQQAKTLDPCIQATTVTRTRQLNWSHSIYVYFYTLGNVTFAFICYGTFDSTTGVETSSGCQFNLSYVGNSS
jgi:hypothetical protein